MVVRNESFQEVDLEIIISDVLSEFKSDSKFEVSEIEAKQALAQMVYQANIVGNRKLLNNQDYAMPVAQEGYSSLNVRESIWERLQRKACSYIDEKTEQERIAEIIAEAIADIIPFKIITKSLLKKVIFYILQSGHAVFCNFTPLEEEIE